MLFPLIASLSLSFLFYLLWASPLDGPGAFLGLMAALTTALVLAKRLPFDRSVSLPAGLGHALRCLLLLPGAIFMAGMRMAALVLQPQLHLRAGFRTVRTKGLSPLGRFLLASFMSLQPGTLSVKIEGKIILLHRLGASEQEISHYGFCRFLDKYIGKIEG